MILKRTIKYDVLKERTKFLKEKEEGIMYLNADLQRLSEEQQMAGRRKGLREGQQEKKGNDPENAE